jgi:hypothetical protein
MTLVKQLPALHPRGRASLYTQKRTLTTTGRMKLNPPIRVFAIMEALRLLSPPATQGASLSSLFNWIDGLLLLYLESRD